MRKDLKDTNNKESKCNELKYQLVGWVLFIICAIFFLASSFKNHDILSIIASIVFLIACIVFLIPLVRAYKESTSSSTLRD
jgi:predicted membrane channel-forming protein YqfA (hemolysin III family)